MLNQREERANETDLIFKQKQNDHEEAHKKIELSNSALKTKEDDISRRLANLAVKEKASFFILMFYYLLISSCQTFIGY